MRACVRASVRVLLLHLIQTHKVKILKIWIIISDLVLRTALLFARYIRMNTSKLTNSFYTILISKFIHYVLHRKEEPHIIVLCGVVLC